MLIVDQQTYQITIDAGDQEKVRFTLTNSDGTPHNGTGASFEFTAKENLDTVIGSAEIRITTALNPSQFDLAQIASGILDLEFLPANTSGLGGKQVTYGLREVDSLGKPHTPRGPTAMIVRKNPTI